MEFEWDEAKSDANPAKRGFGFDFASLVFEGPTLESADDRTDHGEARSRAIGEADGFILAIVYTDRDTSRRIVSARMANTKERAAWQWFVKP
ncbi:BrnT family toxin [Bosea sp. 2KB_26]|uniref:BrnT family toxin n=1 Tax=Bosea sp. 2KB_26 TaxID=3237475 RepID=UPI000DE38743